MSIKSSDSNVESVAGAAVSGLAVGGAFLAAALIGGAIRWLSRSGERSYTEVVVPLNALQTNEIKSVNALRADWRILAQNGFPNTPMKGLDELESAKVKALRNLSSVPFFVPDGTALENSLSLLHKARTPQEVMLAEKGTIGLLEAGHNQVLLQTLTSACARASSKVGFTSVQTEIVPDGTTRVVGVDAGGRAMITEINADKNYNLTIATEIVGVHDGSCSDLMNSFNEALSGEGVRRSEGNRKFTGGVCELAAAKDFIRRKMRPKIMAPTQSSSQNNSDQAIRRTRHLNNNARNKQK